MANLHFIPKMYLKRFVDPDTPAGQEPFLWVFDMAKKEWKKRAPVNVASKTNFYIIEGEIDNVEAVEHFLSMIENKTKLILDKMDKNSIMSIEDRWLFSFFIASLILRTPFMRDRYRFHIEKSAFEIFDKLSKDKELFEARKKEYELKAGIILPESFSHEKLDPREHKISANPLFVKNLSIYLLIKYMEELANLIYSMVWTIVFSTDGLFITSDFPVQYCVNIKNMEDDAEIVIRMRNSDTQVTLPISKSNCFVATWDRKMPKYIITHIKRVRELNSMQIRDTTKFIFSPKPDFPGSDLLY